MSVGSLPYPRARFEMALNPNPFSNSLHHPFKWLRPHIITKSIRGQELHTQFRKRFATLHPKWEFGSENFVLHSQVKQWGSAHIIFRAKGQEHLS